MHPCWPPECRTFVGRTHGLIEHGMTAVDIDHYGRTDGLRAQPGSRRRATGSEAVWYETQTATKGSPALAMRLHDLLAKR